MKQVILLGLMLVSATLDAQINKVDHFFVGSPKAETLFHLFETTLGLPSDWDYKSYGDFSSGAVTLGNVSFEFANYEGATKTNFEGIALEPRQTVEEIIQVLDDAKVAHDTIQPNTYLAPNGMVVGWSNMTLNNLLPDEAGLFICDYKNREKVSSSKKQTADSLKNINGGPLGVMFLKEIVVGTTNLSLHKREMAKLPGIKVHEHELFSFEGGPSIRLIESPDNGIKKIVIKVRSAENAGKYLESHHLMGTSSANSVSIDPKGIDGLSVELVDK